MSRQVSSTLEGLASAIDDLELPVDSGVLTDAFTLADRLNAKLLAAAVAASTTSNNAGRAGCSTGRSSSRHRAAPVL